MVIDDLFSDEESKIIENKLFSFESSLPWFFCPKTVTNDFTQKDYPWFYHQLITNNKSTSDFSQYFLDIFLLKYISLCKKLDKGLVPDFNVIHSMRINLSLSDGNIFKRTKTPIHVDRTFDHLVMIYYINDSDGDTVLNNKIFLNKKVRVTPKRGRILIFNGKIDHFAFLSKKCEKRSIINFNLGYKYEDSNSW